jgi:hypothetical protein
VDLSDSIEKKEYTDSIVVQAGIKAPVAIVPRDTIPRSSGKAKRVMD